MSRAVPARVPHFLQDFLEWAADQADIQAVALVGSHARGTAGPASDVDLVLVAESPGRYLGDRDWAAHFGQIDRQQIERYGLLTSLRVWYSDGLEVEYGLTDERWCAVPLDQGTRRVIADGMRILFERAPILSRHLRNA